jgi:hypothetical protein
MVMVTVCQVKSVKVFKSVGHWVTGHQGSFYGSWSQLGSSLGQENSPASKVLGQVLPFRALPFLSLWESIAQSRFLQRPISATSLSNFPFQLFASVFYQHSASAVLSKEFWFSEAVV